MADSTPRPLTAIAPWKRAPEVGTILGIRFVVALATLAGRAWATRFLWLLAAYYALVSWRVRRVSRTYLSHVGEAPTFSNVLRHVHTFARVTLDRLFFLRGHFDTFVVTTNGNEILEDLTEKKKGAILLGSHLGSFEAMRAVGRGAGMRLSIVVDTRNAERLARVLREVGGDDNLDVIAVDPQGVGTALRVRDAIARGELVGIMADRTLPRDERNVTVDFLGAPAELPAGPFVLAHTLRCPVYTVFGLFHEPNKYDLYCEPFANPVRLDRGARAESIQRYAQQYADSVARHAARAPYNWFNFFDFWKT
jgi:predicted LPLAT superfamily acyltransferase